MSTLHFAAGPATGHVLICATSSRELVAGLLPYLIPHATDDTSELYLLSDFRDRAATRRRAAITAVTRAQDRAVRRAIRDGWSPAQTTNEEIARLNRSREHPDLDGAWTHAKRMPLFLVHGGQQWTAPDGATVIQWKSDVELLFGLKRCGQLRVYTHWREL